jgi:FtsH-binding integral membrane protein
MKNATRGLSISSPTLCRRNATFEAIAVGLIVATMLFYVAAAAAALLPAARFSLARDVWPLLVATIAVLLERFHVGSMAITYALSVLAVWMAMRTFGVLIRAAKQLSAREETEAAREIVWIAFFGTLALSAIAMAIEVTLPRDTAAVLEAAHFTLFIAPTIALFGAALIIWVFSPSQGTAR